MAAFPFEFLQQNILTYTIGMFVCDDENLNRKTFDLINDFRVMSAQNNYWNDNMETLRDFNNYLNN